MQDLVPSDSLRRILDEVFAAPAYAWREEAPATLLLRRWRDALLAWLEALARDHPVLFRALIWVLVGLLALLAAHAVWVLVRTTRRRAASEGAIAAAGRAERRDAAWYAGLAVRLRAEGRFAAAMQAEFLRLVLELDERRVVRFHPSRTPREYLDDFAAGPVRGDFAALIRDLYRFAFAGVPCGAPDLAEWSARARAERYAAPR